MACKVAKYVRETQVPLQRTHRDVSCLKMIFDTPQIHNCNFYSKIYIASEDIALQRICSKCTWVHKAYLIWVWRKRFEVSWHRECKTGPQHTRKRQGWIRGLVAGCMAVFVACVWSRERGALKSYISSLGPQRRSKSGVGGLGRSMPFEWWHEAICLVNYGKSCGCFHVLETRDVDMFFCLLGHEFASIPVESVQKPKLAQKHATAV